MKMTPKIAQCVGLWLAEGNNKCNNELTLTNNCPEIIRLFNTTLKGLLNEAKIRLYVYSPDGAYSKNIVKAQVMKSYRDKRANKPYFIWRVASVELMKEWKQIVQDVIHNPNFKVKVLQGFFAGEGSIKTGSHSNRTIRIAQKDRKPWLEKILSECKLSYKYISKNRSYELYGKNNWDIFAKQRITLLHPNKNQKFWQAYHQFKEEHYTKHYVRDELLKMLDHPFSAKELAKMFNRSQARLSEILVQLKKQKQVLTFRVGSASFWIKEDSNKILISSRKSTYLNIIKKPLRTIDIAKKCGVCTRAASKRLFELEKLGLIERNKNYLWIPKDVKKEIVVI